MIEQFLQGNDKELSFSGLDGLQRKKVHQIAEQFMIIHRSDGRKGNRLVTVVRVSQHEFIGEKHPNSCYYI